MSIVADLHIHTTISDGSDTFEEVALAACEQGLSCIAFTNHDTLKGMSKALRLQEQYPLTIIGGVEISALDSITGAKAHILGLGFANERPAAVTALCAPLLQQRHANTLWQLEQLVSRGYAISREQVRILAEDSTGPYKQHLMAAMTNEPYGSEAYTTLYNTLFKNGGICSRDIRYPDAKEAVAAIKEDGGFAVLAHPGKHGNYELVKQLVAQGLDGIEKYHPDHTKRDWDSIEQLAEEHALFCTGGSDYHGVFGEAPHPGATRIEFAEDHPLTKLSLSSITGL